MTIKETTKFSTDLDPANLFNTLQEAEAHERRVKVRKLVEEYAEEHLGFRFSAEMNAEFIDGLVAHLCRWMGWKL